MVHAAFEFIEELTDEDIQDLLPDEQQSEFTLVCDDLTDRSSQSNPRDTITSLSSKEEHLEMEYIKSGPFKHQERATTSFLVPADNPSAEDLMKY